MLLVLFLILLVAALGDHKIWRNKLKYHGLKNKRIKKHSKCQGNSIGSKQKGTELRRIIREKKEMDRKKRIEILKKKKGITAKL